MKEICSKSAHHQLCVDMEVAARNAGGRGRGRGQWGAVADAVAAAVAAAADALRRTGAGRCVDAARRGCKPGLLLGWVGISRKVEGASARRAVRASEVGWKHSIAEPKQKRAGRATGPANSAGS